MPTAAILKLLLVLLLSPLLSTPYGAARPALLLQELVPAGYVRAPHYTPGAAASQAAAAPGGAAAPHEVFAYTPDHSTVMYVPGHGAFVRRCAVKETMAAGLGNCLCRCLHSTAAAATALPLPPRRIHEAPRLTKARAAYS
jgi:hypothetical protein